MIKNVVAAERGEICPSLVLLAKDTIILYVPPGITAVLPYLVVDMQGDTNAQCSQNIIFEDQEINTLTHGHLKSLSFTSF